ncbi:MAG: phosphatase PAP2 family protein [Actinomycetes bacterium]
MILANLCAVRSTVTGPATARSGVARRSGDRAMTRPPLVREVLMLVALFVGYRLGRILIDGQDAAAYGNAWQVWHLERALGLPDEEALQDWILNWPDALRAANWYYVGVHFPLTAAFLVWGWLRRSPGDYRWARRLIITLTALAFVVHVIMPLAPPRMMLGMGFVDTMATIGPTAYGDSATTVANQFAAMPSLHVGWALLLSLVVIRTTSSRWRWVSVAHPLATTAVVVATANHYWLDAVVAAFLLGLAVLVTPHPARARTWRRQAEVGRSRIGSVVGWLEPPRGSTVSPIVSPATTSVTNRCNVPSPRVSSTPADRVPRSPMTHS